MRKLCILLLLAAGCPSSNRAEQQFRAIVVQFILGEQVELVSGMASLTGTAAGDGEARLEELGEEETRSVFPDLNVRYAWRASSTVGVTDLEFRFHRDGRVLTSDGELVEDPQQVTTTDLDAGTTRTVAELSEFPHYIAVLDDYGLRIEVNDVPDVLAPGETFSAHVSVHVDDFFFEPPDEGLPATATDDSELVYEGMNPASFGDASGSFEAFVGTYRCRQPGPNLFRLTVQIRHIRVLEKQFVWTQVFEKNVQCTGSDTVDVISIPTDERVGDLAIDAERGIVSATFVNTAVGIGGDGGIQLDAEMGTQVGTFPHTHANFGIGVITATINGVDIVFHFGQNGGGLARWESTLGLWGALGLLNSPVLGANLTDDGREIVYADAGRNEAGVIRHRDDLGAVNYAEASGVGSFPGSVTPVSAWSKSAGDKVWIIAEDNTTKTAVLYRWDRINAPVEMERFGAGPRDLDGAGDYLAISLYDSRQIQIMRVTPDCDVLFEATIDSGRAIGIDLKPIRGETWVSFADTESHTYSCHRILDDGTAPELHRIPVPEQVTVAEFLKIGPPFGSGDPILWISGEGGIVGIPLKIPER